VAGDGLRTKLLTREEPFPNNRADPGRIQELKEIAAARDRPWLTKLIDLDLQVRMVGTDWIVLACPRGDRLPNMVSDFRSI